MTPPRLALAAAAALALAAVPRAAGAQAASLVKTFAAVDAVSIQGDLVIVTGVVQGEPAPSTWEVDGRGAGDRTQWAAMCHRAALVAMSEPGRYLLEIEVPRVYYARSTCTLRRANP